MAIKQDDRTPEQCQTHTWAVVAKDRFMSGWGEAKGGASWVAWACPSLEAAERFQAWVADRSEMRCVRVVLLRTYRVPRSAAHFHVYVANVGHVGYRGWVPAARTNSLTAQLVGGH